MARGRGGGTETEVAGRPLLPRYESLPAAEKGGRETERRRGDSWEVNEEEARVSKMTQMQPWITRGERAKPGRWEHRNPRCFHTATPRAELADQNNMAERWASTPKRQQQRQLHRVSSFDTIQHLNPGLTARRGQSPDQRRSQTEIKLLFQSSCKWMNYESLKWMK